MCLDSDGPDDVIKSSQREDHDESLLPPGRHVFVVEQVVSRELRIYEKDAPHQTLLARADTPEGSGDKDVHNAVGPAGIIAMIAIVPDSVEFTGELYTRVLPEEPFT